MTRDDDRVDRCHSRCASYLLYVTMAVGIVQLPGGGIGALWPWYAIALYLVVALWRNVTADETGITEQRLGRGKRAVSWQDMLRPDRLTEIDHVTDGVTKIELGDLAGSQRLVERIRRHFAPQVQADTLPLSEAEIEALLGVTPGGSMVNLPRNRAGCLPSLAAMVLLAVALWPLAAGAWLLLAGWGWLDQHRREIRASAAGLRVRNGWRVRRVAWSRVVAVDRSMPPASRMYHTPADFQADRWIRLAVIDDVPVEFFLVDTHGDELAMAAERIVAEQAMGRAAPQTEGVPLTALSRASGIPAEAERGLSVSDEV